MHKGELVNAVVEDAGVSRSTAGRILDSIIGTVTRTLWRGDRVTLAGFGSFSVTKRKARTGRNPQTGKPVKIPARRVAKFTPGAKLAKAVM